MSFRNSGIVLALILILNRNAAALDPSRQIAQYGHTAWRLWFTTGSVLKFIEPGRYPENRLPPPVLVEEVVEDGTSYQPVALLPLSSAIKNVQIAYTALSFNVPQQVQFRYWLEGWNRQWQDAQTRRQAFYTDLATGNYGFQMMACNDDGVWSEPVTLSLTIAALFYRTAWLRLTLTGAVALLLLWLAYQVRVQQTAAEMKARFDERLAERNRLAGELQDAVLQTVQASRMIAELALQNPSADLRQTVETLANWLAKAETEGQAALNTLEISLNNQNDLAAALRRAVQNLCDQSSMKLDLSVHGHPLHLHPIVRDDILRIGSHAIRNACFHSNGTHLKVDLYYRHDFKLLVRDNGQGFDPEAESPQHAGLLEMREMARRIRARLRIQSRPGSGTDVELVVPGRVAFTDSSMSSLWKPPWR